jgi:uncharacterized membrane protein YccC
VSLRRNLGGAQESRFLTYEKRAMLVLALKTAIAAGISYWIALLAGLTDGYWGSISAIIVLQSNVGSTVTASRDRLIGTLIGAAVGAIFTLLGMSIWIYLLAVVVAMVACSLLGLKNSSRLAGVTVTILMLVHRTPSGFWSNWTLPLHRVLEVLLGIMVALAVSTLVLPSRARSRLREGLVHELLLLSTIFDAVMKEFHGTAAPQLAKLWKDADAAEEANAQLLAAARNEPTGADASLEGLSLLHQLGQELVAALRALELASKSQTAEVTTDDYVAHLEPELGQLTRDLCRAFEYVGRCIHLWKFDTPPEGLSLEDDVAALDAKVAAIRPRGLEFPQQEIFRAYAVQLHLKLLVRLLRSARIETSKAVW